MKAHLYKTESDGVWKRLLAAAALFGALAGAGLLALWRVDGARDEQAYAQLDAALRRAAVTCYAVEGRYPASLNELCTRYGVVIDTSRFAVTYEAFSSNQMPGIHVRQKGGDRG